MVVIVEDEKTIAELERLYLSQAGFGVHLATDGVQGLADIRRLAPVAVIIDVGLPGMDGTEVVRRLRADDNWVPVVFVTAHDSEIDRVVGLELGADDYVPKPCPPRELVARLRAILRRTRGADQPGGVLNAGLLALWPARRRVTCNGETLTLTSTEFNLLEVLLRDAGRVVSKNDLYSRGLGRPMGRFERSIDVHISSIRHKLTAAAGDRLRIESVRGVGYQLVAE
jgi:two-component system OmpR family response regulator